MHREAESLNFQSFVSVFNNNDRESVLFSGKCEIKELDGFLKCICDIPPPIKLDQKFYNTTYRCVNTAQLYNNHFTFLGRESFTFVKILCQDDPYFYQACGVNAGVIPEMRPYLLNDNDAMVTSRSTDDYPCGYFCSTKDMKSNFSFFIPNLYSGALSIRGFGPSTCDGERDCLNTDLDERFCVGRSDETCDSVCGSVLWSSNDCYDESFCNGYFYGVRCKSGWSQYVAPFRVCNGLVDCLDGEDEVGCTVEERNNTSCFHSSSKTMVPLFNFTRCGAPMKRLMHATQLITSAVCENFMDQTNCSDPSRVGVFCPIQGYKTSVAKQIICQSNAKQSFIRTIPQLCDDGLDKACFLTSLSCFLHKHLLCDGHADCMDLSDETHEQCHVMTTRRCYRRYVQTAVKDEMTFPLQWVGDGLNDCMNGEDEVEDWPTCGDGVTTRHTSHDGICREVYLCYKSDHEFILYSNLCDKKESCGNENQICYVSRGSIKPVDTAIRDKAGRVRLSFCLDGLYNVELLKGSTCSLMFFNKWKNIFGQNKTSEIMVPQSKTDCSHVYGEHYVFLSCLDRCMGTKCPLTRPILWNSCFGRFENSRIFTKGGDGRLTFLLRDPETGELGNDMFRCENNKCVSYDKICNLADDCGDGSDEYSCTNHFQCESSKEYLAVTQMCDGIIHCADMTDECNDICGQRLIDSYFLKVVGWMIGISAIILNCISLYNNVSTIADSTSEQSFLNNGLIALMSVGDCLMGLYLLVISIIDTNLGAAYCQKHLDWISSDTCAALGAISTTASQLSLFCMTFLSLLRLGTVNHLHVPESFSSRSLMKLAGMTVVIVCISLVISLAPLAPWLEDSFVNGVRFEAANTLFLGCPDKKVLQATLREYYGRITAEDLSLAKIVKLVRAMFSADYGGIAYQKQSFYGNDAVCLFKYFVKRNDPQGTFVFVIICINFLSFVIIGVSYGKMVTTTKKLTGGVSIRGVRRSKEMNTKLQRITCWIIFTDFVCWVPFIVVCCFHYLDIVEATVWYPFFSILVLPINSVINPIIYDSTLQTPILFIYRKLEGWLKQFLILIKSRQSAMTENADAPVCPDIQLREREPITDQIPLTPENSVENEDVAKVDYAQSDQMPSTLENCCGNTNVSKLVHSHSEQIPSISQICAENIDVVGLSAAAERYRRRSI